MADADRTGIVYLVGAGPGDVGLLTLRAVECLRQADFVLYDYPHAELLCVDQLPGAHPQRWPHIHDRLISEARKGRTVVHLKGGDPLIFGRGGEEAEALRSAGIPYEIVPGVTAAFAAGAHAEIPLTHRSHASAVAFVTGHEHPGKANSRLDWDALARFPGTLVVYMGVARLAVICQEMIARGRGPDTPAALVHRASTGDQLTVTGTLATLEAEVRRAGASSPSLVLIGPVVDLKPAASWAEARPLAGMRVLVTRPKAQGLPFVRQLEQLGAVADLLSAIEIREPADWGPADAAIEHLRAGHYDWVVFTSANGVAAFLARLRVRGLDARTFGSARIAAIGPATAAALADRFLTPDLVPTESTSEGLAATLAETCRGRRVLLAAAAQGREELRTRLAEVAAVDVAPVYEQAEVVPDSPEIFDRLRRGEYQAVTLTSPNVAKAVLAACDETIRDRFRSRHTALVANSDRLAKWLSEWEYPSITAPGPTNDDLVRCLVQLRAGEGPVT
jgi:uroporphyrinogen III methyltransferase / synthase